MLSYNAPTASTDDRKRKAGGPDRPLQAKRRDHSQCGDIASQQFEYLEKPGQSVQSSTRLKCPYYQQNPSRYQKKSCKDVTYDTMRGVKWHLERVHAKAPDCGCCSGSSACPKMLSKLRSINLNRAPFARADPIKKWKLLFEELFGSEEVVPSPHEEKGLSIEEQEVFFTTFTDSLVRNLGPVFGVQYETLSRIVAECRRDARYIYQRGQQNAYQSRLAASRNDQHFPMYGAEGNQTEMTSESVMPYESGNRDTQDHSASTAREDDAMDFISTVQQPGEICIETYEEMTDLRSGRPPAELIYIPSTLQTASGQYFQEDVVEFQDNSEPASSTLPTDPTDPTFPVSPFDINVDIDIDDLIFQFCTQDVFQSPPMEPPLQASAMATSSPRIQHETSLGLAGEAELQVEDTRGPIARLLGLRSTSG